MAFAYFLVCMPETGAQNLVPNGGFEQYTSCPGLVGMIDSAAPWFNATPGAMFGPTPDYFNACGQGSWVGVPANFFGHQAAHGGDAYAGLVAYDDWNPWFKEYIEVPLSSPLEPGDCYEFKAFVNLAGRCSRFAVSDLGVHFADSVVVQTGSTNLNEVPQLDHLGGMITDTLNWVEVSGLYEALGGEMYVVIGNFRDSASSTVMMINANGVGAYCYWYIDDVSLMPVATGCGPLGVGPGSGTLDLGAVEVIYNHLSIRSTTMDNIKVTIVDATGRTLWQSPSSRAATLPLAELPSGLILYVLESDDGSRRCGKILLH